MRETQVWSLGQEDALKKGMATHSSILKWRIPWTEEPDGLQSMGLQRVRHDCLANIRHFYWSKLSWELFCVTHGPQIGILIKVLLHPESSCSYSPFEVISHTFLLLSQSAGLLYLVCHLGDPKQGLPLFLSFTCGFHLMSGWVSIERSFAILCVYPPLLGLEALRGACKGSQRRSYLQCKLWPQASTSKITSLHTLFLTADLWGYCLYVCVRAQLCPAPCNPMD